MLESADLARLPSDSSRKWEIPGRMLEAPLQTNPIGLEVFGVDLSGVLDGTILAAIQQNSAACTKYGREHSLSRK